ncbi:LOW QUALITY PROTEIN: HHIP-like protein 2 [Sylvia borin]
MNEPCYEEVQVFYTFDLRKPILKEVNAWPQAGKSSSSSSGVSFPCPRVCVCLSLLCLTGTLLGHPQCLDYGLPFHSLPLEFCSAYENFDCGDQKRDNSIAAKYWDIMDYVDPQGHKQCGTYIRDILCQEIFRFSFRKAGPFGKFGNAQNKSTSRKVSRIDVDGRSPDGKPYHIPPDNPFVSGPKARLEVYAYGVRNMWCCAVDRGDPVTKGGGRMFCGDVGQNRFEGTDLIVKGGNYSWRAKEGVECYEKLCHNSAMDDIQSIFAYGCGVGRSVTGGFVYRGCESPSWNGLYIIGDFMSGVLFLQEDEKTNKWKKQDICIGSTTACAFSGMINSKFIISFAEDEAGELYFMSISYPSAYTPHRSLYKLINLQDLAPPGKCKKPAPVKTKSKWKPFVPRAKTVLELLNEPSTTMAPKKSSTLTAATGRVSSKKAKLPSTLPSTTKISPPDKERQRVKAEAKPHKGKKTGHNSRTAPAPPLPKKRSSHLARIKEVLPKKAALAKGKVEKRRKKQLLKLSDVPEKASSL